MAERPKVDPWADLLDDPEAVRARIEAAQERKDREAEERVLSLLDSLRPDNVGSRFD